MIYVTMHTLKTDQFIRLARGLQEVRMYRSSAEFFLTGKVRVPGQGEVIFFTENFPEQDREQILFRTRIAAERDELETEEGGE